MTLRRISASRLNSIDQCTMKFYLGEILGLPEKVWARTHAGSAAHSVLEALYRNKHREHYEAVKKHQTIYASPGITRLVKFWQQKTKMENDIVADIDSMCMVAINHTNFLDEGAIQRFEPEHEFKMTLPSGGVVKGFIDRMAEFSDAFVINDYKTARNKFTKAEVANSYQSLVYQLYVWKTFGKLAEVRYWFLRHGPTKMTPKKHLMVTPPATPEQLKGFESYLEYMWNVVNSFGLVEAHSGYCSDQGFCDRVCSYRNPMDYISIKDKNTGELVGNYMLDNVPQLKDNHVAETMHFDGCAKFN